MVKNNIKILTLILVAFFCINFSQQVGESVSPGGPERFVLAEHAVLKRDIYECRIIKRDEAGSIRSSNKATRLCFKLNGLYKNRDTGDSLDRGEGDVYLIRLIEEESELEVEKDLSGISSIEIIEKYGSKFYVKEANGNLKYFWLRIRDHAGNAKDYLADPRIQVSFYFLNEETGKEEGLSHPYLYKINKIENIRRIAPFAVDRDPNVERN